MSEITAPLVEEVDPMKLSLTEMQYRVFSWPDDNGVMQTKKMPYTEAQYRGTAAAFVLKNVKSYQGVQISKKYKKPIGFMSLSLTPEQSKLIKEKIDAIIFNLIFLNRAQLVKDGKSITSPLEISRMYKGIVQKGQEMKDKPGNYYNDSLIASVALKMQGPNCVPDPEQCPIEDLEGNPYIWTSLGGKVLEEVGVEIDRIDMGETEFKVRLNFGFITTKDKAKAKLTSRRRIEQQKDAGHGHVSHEEVVTEPVTDMATAVGSKRKAETEADAEPTVEKESSQGDAKKKKHSK